MSEIKGPWRKTKDKSARLSSSVFLWLGLFLIIGILIGTLLVLFPDHASSEDTYLEITRLVGIMALVSSGLIFARRIKFREAIRNALIWIGIVSVLLLGYTYRAELSGIMYRLGGELIPGLAVPSVPAELVITASVDGHFYVNGKANDKRIRFLVDTGASGIMLSPQAASRIGIDLKNLHFTQHYRTANGIGRGAPYRLKSISIGSFKFENMMVSINKSEMASSLLGMSFLERLQSFEFRGNKLYLRR